MNHKRVYKLYRQEGLMLRTKKPRRHVSCQRRVERPVAEGVDGSWSMNFMSDELFDGRIRLLTIVEEHRCPGYARLILSQKVCAGRIRTNVPTPGYNIQSLFRMLPQHTVAIRCAKSLELPQNGFLRGNQGYSTEYPAMVLELG